MQDILCDGATNEDESQPSMQECWPLLNRGFSETENLFDLVSESQQQMLSPTRYVGNR